MQVKYDDISTFYHEFVRDSEHYAGSVIHLLAATLLELLGDIHGELICDLACGEGHLARAMAQRGAQVIGVDVSEKLLIHARAHSMEFPGITFQHSDAHKLSEFDAAVFENVVSNMAMMDFENHYAVFDSVARVLKPSGLFTFSLLHPCFEPPFYMPDETCVLDEVGDFAHIRIQHYLREGYWQSGGDGMRGRVGAYHRTLSTYVNDLLATGFQIVGMFEPTLPPANYDTVEEQWLSLIPRGLIIQAQKKSG